MNNKARQDIQRKLKVFKYAAEVKNISKACRYFGISRETYYVLKRKGLNVLPKNQRKRNIKEFKRYEKQVPGHRVQRFCCI